MKFSALPDHFYLYQGRGLRVSILFPSFSLLFLILTACKMNEHSGSNDPDALNKIIRLEVNLQTVRWEIFTTPEYQEGVPGPTDYISLVIETNDFVTSEISQNSTSGLIWIAPEAARPWMTKESKLFFDRFKNQTIDIASQKNCSSVSAWLVKTNKKIEGITCKNSLNRLMYFVLEDYTS